MNFHWNAKLLPGARHRIRAFSKVQDGCDAFCTFCVTRIARGRSRSEPVERILTDIRSALHGGAQEIVLTGVQLGSWGKHLREPSSLPELVKIILQETDSPRLRFSSIEPWDIDQDFFELFSNPRICRHLHIALQSGSASTLKRMGRRQTPDEFREKLSMPVRWILISPSQRMSLQAFGGKSGRIRGKPGLYSRGWIFWWACLSLFHKTGNSGSRITGSSSIKRTKNPGGRSAKSSLRNHSSIQKPFNWKNWTGSLGIGQSKKQVVHFGRIEYRVCKGFSLL